MKKEPNDDRRMSEDNLLTSMLNENYIGGDQINRVQQAGKNIIYTFCDITK